MNVFEDLIVELKQENLLERSVIDDQLGDDDLSHLEETVVPNTDTESEFEINGDDEFDIAETVEIDDYHAHLEDTVVPDPKPEPVHVKPRNGREFYRKRAVAEVSNLQMVEHVLTGVEREYMKVKPHVFDDFEAKKALNTFLQVSENENSAEHSEAEFRLMAETEAWCTALAERDKEVSVASLRQYCEGSKPPLSSQALVALGRFYRNLPYSEGVRSKFDFVITRLFSRAVENELRIALFNREETLGHIQTLYRDWSSIALYGAHDDDSDLSLAAMSFADLAAEAENAPSFDHLIEQDFFNRVRNFKESIGEIFYAPSVLAGAIDANVRIGNAYVKLIAAERKKLDAETIQTKYAELYDDTVSEGIGRTLELVEILRSPAPSPDVSHEADEPVATPVEKTKPSPAKEADKEDRQRHPFVERMIASILGMNRWLVGVSALLIAVSLGIYVYANYFVDDRAAKTDVRQMSISDPLYKDYVTSGVITDQTLHGVLLANWDTLPKEKKLEILTKLYNSGKENGFNQVNLIAADGRSAGFASANRIEVFQR